MGGLEALQQLKSLKGAVPVSTGGRSRDNGGATVLCGTSKQQDKYPEAVHLSEGASSTCMGVRSTSHPEFELVIVWRIQVDDEGRAVPKLDLLPRVPQRALELDQNGIIEAAPVSFRALLGALGIEAALESLIVTLRRGGRLVPTQ
ncbi:Centromere protein P [Manis javanica]|nr:Centromere protein P [Manis javanica]